MVNLLRHERIARLDASERLAIMGRSTHAEVDDLLDRFEAEKGRDATGGKNEESAADRA